MKITLSYVSRGNDGKTAAHTTIVDMDGISIENENVVALLSGQMGIKEQAYFAKKPAEPTNEKLSFAAFVARAMTRGAGTKALLDENERLKAQIAEMEAKQKQG